MFVPYQRMSRLRRQRTDALSESDSVASESPAVSDNGSSDHEEDAEGDVFDLGVMDSSGTESCDSDSEPHTGEIELAAGMILYFLLSKP